MPKVNPESNTTNFDGIIGFNYPSGMAVNRCFGVVGRVRSWNNTANYSSTPRGNLPFNRYVDEQWNVSQPGMVQQQITNPTTGLLQGITWDGRDSAGLINTISEYATRIQATGMQTQSDQINETILKALKKMADAKVNLPVALAESAKTSTMILDRASSIYNAYRSLRRGNFRDVAKNLNLSPRTVHKTWLEYKYGWTPLLMDVKGSAELLAQHHLGKPQTFSITAVVNRDRKTVDSGPLEGWSSLTRVTSLSRKCKVRIDCEVVNPLHDSLKQTGLTNPALVAWELVPFSFVFDWFISVGDWLNGFSALGGVNVKRAFQSWEKVLEYSRSGSMFPVNGYDSGFSSLILGKYRAYERYPIQINPWELKPVVNADVFNWQKTITSLSLFRANSHRFK